MAEKFAAIAQNVASGTNKTVINLFNPAATPTSRGRVTDVLVSSHATPADQACQFVGGRSTAVGTEGAGYVPNNLDPAGPAGAYDSGNAHSAEPTYTSNKELLNISMNQRALGRWVANPGYEILMAATQNNGLGIYSRASTSTQNHDMTIFFEE